MKNTLKSQSLTLTNFFFNINSLKIAGIKTLLIFVFSITMALLLFCLFQVNSYVHSVFSLRGLEKEFNSLSDANKSLELNFSKTHSLSNVDQFIANGNFVKINNIQYVRLIENTVAAK